MHLYIYMHVYCDMHVYFIYVHVTHFQGAGEVPSFPNTETRQG